MRRVLAVLAAATAAAASLMITTVGSAAAQPPAAAASVAGGQQAGITPNSKLPTAIQVDETQFKIVQTMRGTGKQVYDCVAPATPAYKFREPMAVLTNLRDGQVGIHGAGPFWASFDGSKVIGASAGSAPAPNPSTDIPWLKVAATSNAGVGGVLSNVTFIQRTDTRGGQPPTSCTVPSTVAVNYTTMYVFWAKK